MTKLDRTKSVGGSDVAAILGLSPWRTPLDVWREKCLGERDERDTPAMRAGVKFEAAIIAQMMRDMPGLALVESAPAPTVVGYRHASPDAIVQSADGWRLLVEAKTTKEPWTDGVPLYYRAQVQWYLDLLQLDDALVPVLTWPFDMRDLLGLSVEEVVAKVSVTTHTVTHDPAACAEIRRAVAEFWEINVIGNRPPAPRSLADAKRLVHAVAGKAIDADDELVRLLEERAQLKAAATEIDERAEANELAIRAKLGDAEMAVGFLSGKPLVTAKVVSRAGYTTNVKPTSYRSLTVAKNWRDL